MPNKDRGGASTPAKPPATHTKKQGAVKKKPSTGHGSGAAGRAHELTRFPSIGVPDEYPAGYARLAELAGQAGQAGRDGIQRLAGLVAPTKQEETPDESPSPRPTAKESLQALQDKYPPDSQAKPKTSQAPRERGVTQDATTNRRQSRAETLPPTAPAVATPPRRVRNFQSTTNRQSWDVVKDNDEEDDEARDLLKLMKGNPIFDGYNIYYYKKDGSEYCAKVSKTPKSTAIAEEIGKDKRTAILNCKIDIMKYIDEQKGMGQTIVDFFSR